MSIIIQPVAAQLIRDVDTFTRMVNSTLFRILMLLSHVELKNKELKLVIKEVKTLTGMNLYYSKEVTDSIILLKFGIVIMLLMMLWDKDL
jgi:hypothetical protein